MKIELAQITIRDGEPETNLARVLEVIQQRRPGTELMVFPETQTRNHNATPFV
ncbi:hypothetical protein [Paraherbaspirillum soli]|uniref:CN hydrolase domain-containing protein n=1 Tax=Paraherbaspirillum soli TaxID=631222 RepID=A0ABW0M5X2_9BURK